MDEDEEVIQEFLIEGYEGLDRLDQELLALEDDPNNPGQLASIFRTIHSLKGTSGFLGFNKLESISHVGENLLSNMRDGTIELNQPITDALLQLVDASREILTNLENTGEEGDGNYDELVATLAELADAVPAPTPVAQLTAPTVAPQVRDSLQPVSPLENSATDEAPPSELLHPASPTNDLEQAASLAPAADDGSADSDPEGDQVTASQTQSAPPPPPPPSVRSSEPAPTHAPALRDNKASGDMTIRVDVSVLDRLMNLVGELVLARNQILQVSSRSEDASFLATTQRLNHITTELQEGLMKTRMQPIKSVWAKFPRVVRDLAKTCEKDVRIEMEGEDTELDRTIIEAIKDPMTHIVRNSVDHGIEFPEDRYTRGKARQGRLSLRAYHEGGKVNIEIADDGKGLDVKRIRAKAVEKGLVSAAELARMTEREAMQLIFAPGFSTAEAVTQVSGRGVGMDVVKTNIERIGGTIELSSRLNMGTTIKIKIPLTLAIIPALVINCGGDSYAIPQVSLLELVRFEKIQAETAIEHVHGAPVCRLRGNLLPLVYLHDVLGVTAESPEDEAINIVVLQADDRQFGLVVDHVSDTEEIVVKPLGKELKNVEIFAGATIMGDGRVALILDVIGVAKAGGLASQERDRRLRHVGVNDRDAAQKYTMLVFKINEHERGAVPLKSIARLEEVPTERIERSGGEEVVQYRGEIMPLIRISTVLGRPTMPAREIEQVLVYQRKKHSVGVIVEAIEDVVEEQLDVQRPVTRVGVKGQAVLQGRVTELIDLSALMESALPGFFDANAAE